MTLLISIGIVLIVTLLVLLSAKFKKMGLIMLFIVWFICIVMMVYTLRGGW